MSRLRHLAARLIAGALAVAIGAGSSVRGDEPSPMLILTTRQEGPYGAVLSGIGEALGNASHRLDVRSMGSRSESARAALERARSSSDVPIITVGSVATRAALDVPGEAPVIACMVVDSPDFREAENATGVLLDFPLETQLEWMRRLVPHGHTIGVLYNPAENQDQIDAASRVARRLGMDLVARQVHRPQDLPAALDDLSRKADLLWGVTDQVVLSQQTAEAILLFSFRNRIPFSGLSASWVKAGALYALDRDYEDLGAQCGEMAIEVLDGRRVSAMPIATPRKLVYVLNLRTAEHLKLDLPPEIVAGAHEVFQ